MANLCSVNVHENDIFFINPEINTLHSANGIYHLISNDVTYNYYILNDELKYHGLKEISKERFICIFEISKKMNIRISNKKLCNYFDIKGNYNEF